MYIHSYLFLKKNIYSTLLYFTVLYHTLGQLLAAESARNKQTKASATKEVLTLRETLQQSWLSQVRSLGLLCSLIGLF